MENLEKCKKCGKEFKTVNTMHIKTHGLTSEQYEAMPEYDEFAEMESLDVEPQGNTKVTPNEMEDRIWGKDRKKDVHRPLQDFLDEFMLTEEEARDVLKKFTRGDRIDPRLQAKNFKKIGDAGAAELKDEKKVETTSLHIAESLTTNYGFTCTNVIGAKGNKPKTWVLEK